MFKLEFILLVLSVITLLMLLCTILIFFVSYNKKMVQDQQLELQNSRLSNAGETLLQIELSQLVSTISMIRKEYIKERERLPISERNQYDISFYDKWLHFSNDDDFFALIDGKLDKYVSKFKNDYPNLSIKELKMTMCYLLQIPDNDISTLFGYSILSIPTIKNRLCKKLGLNHASKLFDFLYKRLV